jgi:hypothetical protein
MKGRWRDWRDYGTLCTRCFVPGNDTSVFHKRLTEDIHGFCPNETYGIVDQILFIAARQFSHEDILLFYYHYGDAITFILHMFIGMVNFVFLLIPAIMAWKHSILDRKRFQCISLVDFSILLLVLSNVSIVIASGLTIALRNTQLVRSTYGLSRAALELTPTIYMIAALLVDVYICDQSNFGRKIQGKSIEPILVIF